MLPEAPPRRATLVLCIGDGAGDGVVLGALPPFELPAPYWPETADLVATARALHGVDVTVLRLLETDRPEPPGGTVTYLVELTGGQQPYARDLPALVPWTGPDPLAQQPLRQSWASPGGPARAVAWALDELARAGAAPGTPQQVRTWNLSTLWRIPTAGPSAAAWLKVVPPFFAHEGALIGLLAREHRTAVPTLLAADGPRVLLDEIDGTDLYDASWPELTPLVDLLVGIQAGFVPRVDELLALGLPDWRAASFPALAGHALERSVRDLDAGTVAALTDLVDGLPRRFADLASCGVPDTLVHGDFHPGNAIGGPAGLRLLDWGDAGVGHPLLDQAAFCARRSVDEQVFVRAHWSTRWRAAVPGCDPDRAAALLEPVAALRQAVIYQMFLDRIEPDEQVYHRMDPARWLRQAAERFASASRPT